MDEHIFSYVEPALKLNDRDIVRTVVCIQCRIKAAWNVPANEVIHSSLEINGGTLKCPKNMTTIVTLKGKSLKGKNRVREQGSEWHLAGTRMSVSFSSIPGPWLLLISPLNDKNIRWVNQNNDIDFLVMNISSD